MSQLTQLTTTEILEKEFRTEIRGYSQSEVDEYLDRVIQDYTVMEKEVARLRKENEALHRDLEMAMSNKRIAQAVPVPTTNPTTRTESSQFTNYDVIKRVAQLERQVAQLERQFAQQVSAPTPQPAEIAEPIEGTQPLTQAEIEKTLQFTFTK